jgi:DNA invertase Pin-like site-specific DNA recombinase
VALGWTLDRVITIDSDLGQSGASAVDREGFQRLVAEVGVGKAGIVLGLEVPSVPTLMRRFSRS